MQEYQFLSGNLGLRNPISKLAPKPNVSCVTHRMSFLDDTSQTYFLLLYVLPEAITETMLDPLIPYMIRSLSTDVPPDQLDAVIGGRSGLLGGVFYLPLLVMNIFWGTLSDVLGRKPILILGLLFSALTTFVLGINTTSFVIALFCRFMAGVFGSNSTVAKGALGEIHLDEKGRGWAYSLYGSVYAFSGIVGPLIGGILVDSGDATASYPYFNACFFGSVLGLVAFGLTQVHFREPKELRLSKVEVEDSIVGSEASGEEWDDMRKEGKSLNPVAELMSVPGMKRLWSSLREPMTGKVMFPILLYVLIAFCNRAWSTLLPLLFSAKQENGGLGYTAFDTSFAMTIAACSKLLFQTVACQPIVARFGTNTSYCIGMAAVVPACLMISFLGGTSGTGVEWILVLICMSLFGFVEALVYLSVIMMISDSVTTSSLGAAHGLAATCAAAVRTIAPPLVGYVWEFVAVQSKQPWTAFVIVEVAAILSIWIARTGRVTRGGVSQSVYQSVEEEVEMTGLN
ncbi:hypothetical protein HDU98_005607 [Podochytrium sp. JEL0797]|nr:hypothetical protein HDU98_005607 [Podochytrium sp. JEL0797]